MKILHVFIVILSLFLVEANAQSQAVDVTNKMTFEQATKTLGISIPKPDPKDKSPCAGLAYAIFSCQAYACETPLKDDKKTIIHHDVAGLDGDKACQHRQTTPQGKFIDCRYSPAMRIYMAKTILAKEPLSEEEQEILSKTFTYQCDIKDQL
jgi:uncharacterized OsmC-like protein